MPRTALVVKTERLKQKHLRFLAAGKKMKKATRVYHRCKLCGRNRGYMGDFDMCRICFRELAQKGEIPGLTKSSW